MNPMFSHRRVRELEPLVQDKVLKLCKLMQDGIARAVPVDLHHAFRAVSIDVISDFAFNRSYDFLDRDDLGAYFFRIVRGIGPAMWLFQQLPSFQAAALRVPPWLMPYLSGPLGHVMRMQQECVKQIEGVKRDMAAGKHSQRPTIFSTLLTGDDKPDGYRIPSTMDVKDEAYAVLVAASETTGNAMTVATFNVLANPPIYEILVRELQEASPDPNTKMAYVDLERLPYLVSRLRKRRLSSLSDGCGADRRDKRSSSPLLWCHWTPSPRRPTFGCYFQRPLCSC